MNTRKSAAELTIFNSKSFALLAGNVSEHARSISASVLCNGGDEGTGVVMNPDTFYVRWSSGTPKVVEAFWIKQEDVTFLWPSVEAFGVKAGEKTRVIHALHVPVNCI